MSQEFENFRRRQDDALRQHNRTVLFMIVVATIALLAVMSVGVWAILELVQWVTTK